MSPEIRSLLVVVSTIAGRWDSYHSHVDPWSSSGLAAPAKTEGGTGPTAAATSVQLLVERDSATLHHSYAEAVAPVSYKAQAIYMAGMLFSMAPGKEPYVAPPQQQQQRPSDGTARATSDSALPSQRATALSSDDDSDGEYPPDVKDPTLTHHHHVRPASSSPPPPRKSMAPLPLGGFGYGTSAHHVLQTQRASQDAAMAEARFARAVVLGREHVVALAHALIAADTDPPWEDVPGALLWCLVVGAYAAHEVEAHAARADLSEGQLRETRQCGFFFRRELKRVLLSIGLSRWEEMVGCFRVVVWLVRCRWWGTVVPR